MIPPDRAPQASGGRSSRALCGATLYITSRTAEDVRTAIALSHGPGLPELIYRILHCTTEAHDGPDHWALVADLLLRSPGDIWATWTGTHQPHALVEVGYCTATTGDEVCFIVDGHRGGHSWELSTPAGTTLRMRTGPRHQRPRNAPTLRLARAPHQRQTRGDQA